MPVDSLLSLFLRRARLRTSLALAFCVLSSVRPCAAQITADDVKAAHAQALEPRAIQLLQRMVAAYARLRVLDQTTAFYSALIPLSGAEASHSTPPPTDAELTASSGDDAGVIDSTTKEGASKADAARDEEAKPPTSQPQQINRSLRLLVSSPNRLRLEMLEVDLETHKALQSLWISDGATFTTYKQDKNWYTQEKAPKNLRDFARLPHLNSGSLELLMLMGVNPFAAVQQQAKTIRIEGTALVHGVTTDVVTIHSVTPADETEARFFIGYEDGLLRRVVLDSTPLAGTARPGIVGDALDELAGGYTPPAPLPGKTGDAPPVLTGFRSRSRVILDNKINPDPAPKTSDFAFRVPNGAMYYDPLGSAGYNKLSQRSARLQEILKGMQPAGKTRQGKQRK